MQPIIKSLLDTDLYKFTVMQIVYNRFGNIEAEYEFTCRNKDKVNLLKYVSEEELRFQIFKCLPKLALSQEEYEWLAAKGYFQETYLQYLRNFRFNPDQHITITRDEEAGTYRIVAKGPWAAIILYETMVLCIVNEIYETNYSAQNNRIVDAYNDGMARLKAKTQKLIDYNDECLRDGFGELKFIEFGTRRRYSRGWQDRVLEYLTAYLPDNLSGTSNVYLAFKYGIPEVGTFGHEFPMAMQGIYPIQKSQRMALRIWLQEYNGLWGTVLGDTLGDEKFFKDFTYDFAKGYDGVRHDSGDPFAYGERIIAMYEGYNINPRTKKIVFSDGLDFDTMIALHRQFRGRIQVLFGIGTDLTNDVGNPTLQIVMKIVMSNGQDVCKFSANPAKASCRNKLYLDYARMACERY